MAKLVGQGGLVGYFGTNDAVTVEKRIDAGDEEAALSMKRWHTRWQRKLEVPQLCLKGKSMPSF